MTNSSQANDYGIFRGDGVTGPVQIARTGDLAPDTNDRFFLFALPALNEAGQTAFSVSFTNAQGQISGSGILRGDELTGLVPIARAGDPTPDGNGTFSQFGDVVLNNAGRVAFTPALTGGGFSYDKGIYLGDGTPGSLVRIARTGQAVPDGNGIFSFDNPQVVLNDAGQAAFLSLISETSSTERGIFFYDDEHGLTQVVREGGAFLGSTITLLTFNGGAGFNGSFNDLGQIAYGFSLADGRSGIALWGPPDPNRLVGDYDANGLVGQGDLALVLQFWGTAVTAGLPPDRAWIDASDVTGSLIGQDELATVLQHWGDTAAIASQLDAITTATGLDGERVLGLVPEPGTAALVVAAGPLLLRHRSRRPSC